MNMSLYVNCQDQCQKSLEVSRWSSWTLRKSHLAKLMWQLLRLSPGTTPWQWSQAKTLLKRPQVKTDMRATCCKCWAQILWRQAWTVTPFVWSTAQPTEPGSRSAGQWVVTPARPPSCCSLTGHATRWNCLGKDDLSDEITDKQPTPAQPSPVLVRTGQGQRLLLVSSGVLPQSR